MANRIPSEPEGGARAGTQLPSGARHGFRPGATVALNGVLGRLCSHGGVRKQIGCLPGDTNFIRFVRIAG